MHGFGRSAASNSLPIIPCFTTTRFGCRQGVWKKGVTMLVLARQRDQAIMIGHEIEVSVVDIRGDKVRLGINAPRSVSVHRKEIYDAIRRENQAAAQVKPEDVSGVAKAPAPKPPDKDEKK